MKRHALQAVRAIVSVAAAFALVAFLGVGSSLATEPPPRGLSTFSDPAGDAQGGPDITKVEINGTSDGSLAFLVTAAGLFPASPELSRQVSVKLVTDKDGSTVYWFGAGNDSDGLWWWFDRWNGSDWEETAGDVLFTQWADVFRWVLDTSDIGGVGAFQFRTYAGTWPLEGGDPLTLDRAPESNADGTVNFWQYQLPAPIAQQVVLNIDAPNTTPKLPAAGKRFTVAFPVSFEVTSSTVVFDPIYFAIEREVGVISLVNSGSMVCDPSVTGKVVEHAESLKGGKAQLAFVVPKAAKGKLLRVSVKITATEPETGTTLTTKRVATFRVR